MRMIMLQLRFILLILLVALANGNEQKRHRQAELRAALAKSKTLEETLVILRELKDTGPGPKTMMTRAVLKEEVQTILGKAKQKSSGGPLTMFPRNGVCAPRVVCEPVPIDRQSSETLVSSPLCLEVHRCGGCCQEGQFSCEAIEQNAVAFSPILLIDLESSIPYEVDRPVTMINHTKCDCKCSKTEDDCRREGKALDESLCQCMQPRCSPECVGSAVCSTIRGIDTPRCTCRRRLIGQNSNYCPGENQRPNWACSRCEQING